VTRARATRLLTARDGLDHLEPALREEVSAAREAGPVMAAFEGTLPVSFCYPHHATERWWDVSIDTVAGHRRRGFAAAAAGALIAHLRGEGREPVWGALDENPASGATARALGFFPAVPFALLSPPDGA
jgi:predicted GNAT family acetyltransferase